jgi:hypothetical protein
MAEVALKECSVRQGQADSILLEKLADLEHKQWSIWMTWLFSISKSKGSDVTQRTERWRQWRREANTPYSQLSEREKDSDREFARRVLKVLDEHFAGLVNQE